MISLFFIAKKALDFGWRGITLGNNQYCKQHGLTYCCNG